MKMVHSLTDSSFRLGRHGFPPSFDAAGAAAAAAVADAGAVVVVVAVVKISASSLVCIDLWKYY